MNLKKLILLNLPYLLFVYPLDKLSQATVMWAVSVTSWANMPIWTS